jgi:hypothetical protein
MAINQDFLAIYTISIKFGYNFLSKLLYPNNYFPIYRGVIAMNINKALIILLSLFFLWSIILGTAIAGDDVNPEVSDDTGETEDPSMQFRDIDSVWIGDEGNDTIQMHMKLVGNPPGFADLAQTQDTETYDYEVYFDVEDKSYAVVAIIQYAALGGKGTPLEGFFSSESQWTWELREIDYAEGTDLIQSESKKSDITVFDYDSQDVILEWEINKEAIGIGIELEGRGQLIENTWAAIWNADDNSPGNQRDPKTQSWDYAHTHHSNPGKTYRITGFGGVDYNIVLSVTENEKETFGGTPVEFVVSARNNGTHNFEVDFFISDSPEGWIVEISPNSTMITKSASRPLTVTVTPPKSVENGTIAVLRIEGNINEIEGNGSVPVDPPLTLRIKGLSPPGENEEGAWWENLVDTIKDNIIIVGGAIAVVIIAIIIFAVLIKR